MKIQPTMNDLFKENFFKWLWVRFFAGVPVRVCVRFDDGVRSSYDAYRYGDILYFQGWWNE